ncbi:hypothetical protein [Pseudoalteromonas arctica]|uniref:Uncharacterized protein n=1 Tax=Pseudoalteromonas arctica TaxID=394751 RepID=A0A7Y0DQ78_9GAMM|nr:hypothetical protein [Pseudoalteromonas arctica]NMM39647.1 hypothetical protein [Pseudoalteromonas arctica]
MKNLLNKGIAAIKSTSGQLINELNKGVVLVTEKLNGLPIFMSLERFGKQTPTSYDEKHYFVIPFELSEYKFALHTMRLFTERRP